ncbi:MAG: endo alpha-1,4 polygalactosaminidase [Polyangiaceae bacterium]
MSRALAILSLLGIAACSSPEPSDSTPARPELPSVTRWFYYLDVNLDDGTLQKITTSTYDMVVMDPIVTEQENQDYPIGETVAGLHAAEHPKLVFAYIDVGQAEDYRTYWQPDWQIGDPDWITAVDPDGWEGNYPCAYWRPEWKAIWLGAGGYMDQILAAGFDGVYLDWIEAYSDENVLAAAAADGVDAKAEMLKWIGEIGDYGRARDPRFLVIAQNAAELALEPGYSSLVDAIAQEQVWFDGAADNDPPGDCPLPATEADVDTAAYADSLSPGCRQTYDDYPDSTLHVSTESYLDALAAAEARGLLIFTVDYALEPDHVDHVYREARERGFVPFAGSRALNAYIEPVP